MRRRRGIDRTGLAVPEACDGIGKNLIRGLVYRCQMGEPWTRKGHFVIFGVRKKGHQPSESVVQANKTLAASGWTTFGTEVVDEDENVLIVRCTKSVTEQPSCHLRLRVRLDTSVGL